ncbi:tenascin C [Cavenderia fasciculata]|uniref:Tenascin C n=1 Tax=Cavenderia fasciculata TaxID=261658 RepID=F4PIS9_CACFS|nr:tenascin C [Cavenderia fasciculata]EGG24658.1 tenascin C [Cavenderia fasciculata]|eukprot:XP_004362509.1 tenascin C [Cavenderia fasciculata]
MANINSKFVLYVFIFFFSTVLLGSTNVVSQPLLPALELESAVFVIRVYGLTTQQDQTLCGAVFTCSAFPDGYLHVIRIQIMLSTFTGAGQPNSSLTTLYFPKLTVFEVSASSLPPFNIMDRMTSLKTLRDINIVDASLTYLPSDFTGFPELATFSISGTQAKSIPSNFLNNSTPWSIKFEGPFELISFDDTLYLPELTHMYIKNSNFSNSIIDLTPQSFPKLSTLEVNFMNAGSSLTINHQIPILPFYLTCTSMGSITDNKCQINLDHPETLQVLLVTGPQSTISPPIGSAYLTLGSLSLQSMALTNFPLSSYPPTLKSLNLGYNQLTTIPAIDVPPSLVSLGLQNNQLLEPIPMTIFNNNLGLTKFDLQNNPTFTGPITEDYCIHQLYIMNTGIITLPDCIWCWKNVTNLVTVSTSLPYPTSGVNCNDYKIDNSSRILVKNNTVEITGTNIGWGFVSAANYTTRRIIANTMIQIVFNYQVPNNLTPVILDLGTFEGAPHAQFQIIQGGIFINSVIAQQQPTGTSVTVKMDLYNPFLVYTLRIDGTIDCNTTILSQTEFIAMCPPISSGEHFAYVLNEKYAQYKDFDFTLEYPIVTTVTPVPSPQGSLITLTGNYGNTFSSPSVKFMAENTEIAQCPIQSINSTVITCLAGLAIENQQVELLITVDGFSTSYIISMKDICQQSTNNCNGNGGCNNNGICVCSSPSFYNNCSKPYPIISSASYDSTNNKLVSLNGDFGPFGQVNPTIKINNTLDCTVNYKSQWVLNCTLDQSPNYGLSSVQLQVDSLDTTARNILILRPTGNGGGSTTTTTTTTTTSSTSGGSPGTQQEKCEKDTFNCYGHGKCDIYGICQCDDNYNPDDNCFTKFSNTTIKPNTTDPTISFDIDGIDFQFEIVSIQELDLDGNTILKELFISNYSWNVNVSSNNIITIVNYQLNTTTNSSSSPSSSSSFQSVLVSSTISFSTQSRDIQFGDQTLHINPNSIKLAVNITNWQYSSNLATLRVVFRTIINNNQTVEYDCQDKNVEPLTYDSLSSLQYLRVVKDNVQFNGRFIDFALSDGRPTYSQTQLISSTQLDGGDDEQSIAMIGINFPQCHECVLDPDFTPLLIDKGNDSGCGNDKQSDTWRIIVGAVVGGVGAIAIAVASFLTYKMIQKKRAFNKHITNKLKTFDNINLKRYKTRIELERW